MVRALVLTVKGAVFVLALLASSSVCQAATGRSVSEGAIERRPKFNPVSRHYALHLARGEYVTAHLGQGWRAEVAAMTVVDAILGG